MIFHVGDLMKEWWSLGGLVCANYNISLLWDWPYLLCCGWIIANHYLYICARGDGTQLFVKYVTENNLFQYISNLCLFSWTNFQPNCSTESCL